MVCFLGMGCRGTVSFPSATPPWKNSWVSLCASLQGRQGDGEHEKAKGDETRINGPKMSRQFVKTEPAPRSEAVCPARPRTSKWAKARLALLPYFVVLW